MSKKTKQRLMEFSFLVPALIVFFAIIVLPFIQGFPISFTDWDGMSPTRNFVGFNGYARVFTDKNVVNATKNTVLFTVLTVIFPNLLGLAIALLISKSTRFNKFIRTFVFMPYCLSIVLSSIIWKYLYNDILYGTFGVLSPLGRAEYAIYGISVICIWATTGYCMTVYIASIQSVPLENFEVAQLEGASRWQSFIHVTLPYIVPGITSNVTLLLAWGMKAYDYPMTATQGGPGRATETLSLLIYYNFFQYFRAGYGQALAIVFTIVISIITLLVSRALRSQEVEV